MVFGAQVGCSLPASRATCFFTSRRPVLRVRAEGEQTPDAAPSSSSSSGGEIQNFKNFGVLDYPRNDTETFNDVFGFSGSAPEVGCNRMLSGVPDEVFSTH